MNFSIDTRLPAIGSTSQYGHRWDTVSILVDVYWPGFGLNLAHRLPDSVLTTSRYLNECRETLGVFVGHT